VPVVDAEDEYADVPTAGSDQDVETGG
jgi:hypothetical protein